MKHMILFFAVAVLAVGACYGSDFAYRLTAEVQTSGPQSLDDITWQQGTTPLIQVDPLRRGKAIDADSAMEVRMVIGPSGTGAYYAEATNYLATNTYYLIQWPTIGTNSVGTNGTTDAWWYTIYFQRDGHRYWTGNGRLYIEETTSTAEDGLVWQTVTANTIEWGNIAGDIANQTDVAAYVESLISGTQTVEVAYGTSSTTATRGDWGAAVSNTANTALSTATGAAATAASAYTAATQAQATADAYTETDPVWTNDRAQGFTVAGPVTNEGALYVGDVDAGSSDPGRLLLRNNAATPARWDGLQFDDSGLMVIKDSEYDSPYLMDNYGNIYTDRITNALAQAGVNTGDVSSAMFSGSTNQYVAGDGSLQAFPSAGEDSIAREWAAAASNLAASAIFGATISAAGADAVTTNDGVLSITWNTNEAHYVDTDTGATNIVAGDSDTYDAGARTLTWNTNAVSSGSGSGNLTATNTPTAGQMLYASGTDNDTLYWAAAPAGGGIDSAIASNSFVNKAGDTMTGALYIETPGGLIVSNSTGPASVLIGNNIKSDSVTLLVGIGAGVNVSAGAQAGVAIGYLANGVGGVALGQSSCAAGAYDTAVGHNAGAYLKSVAIGDTANARSTTGYGVAVGEGTYGGAYGVAVGRAANGLTYGSAVGSSANATHYGISLGTSANGTDRGIAIGVSSRGSHTNIAIGTSSFAGNSAAQIQRIAIGLGVSNAVNNSIRVRGDLYLDGGTNRIFFRPTFGSGDFVQGTLIVVTNAYTGGVMRLATDNGNTWMHE